MPSFLLLVDPTTLIHIYILLVELSVVVYLDCAMNMALNNNTANNNIVKESKSNVRL